MCAATAEHGLRQQSRWRIWSACIVVCGMTIASNAFADPDDDFFETRVRPLLVKHCMDCHGAKKQEGSLRLDSRDAWRRGGDRGKAIVVGKPNESLLIQAIRHDDPDLKMPPNAKKLSAADIAVLESWVKRGAPDPRREKSTPSSARLNLEDAHEFWSLQPVKQPAVPLIENDEWSQTPIDVFVLARLKQQGLSPVSDADRRTLIRRATLDLTGLPPTPDEIESFLNDHSNKSFERLIDRLLKSPAYGERWGRHWLDVARYADTAGDGADYPVREAVKYRDWVIAAFNNDQPYDQFVREQIAGDIFARKVSSQLANANPSQAANIQREYARLVTATGFLAIGKRYGYKPSPDYQHLDFADVIDSVGRSLLGLSLGCARCHDHKYDPVSAADYYGLYGIFQSTKWAFPGGEELKRPAHFPATVPPQIAEQLDKAKSESLSKIDAELGELKRKRNRLDPNWRAGGLDLALEAQAIGKPPGKPWVHAGPIEIRADSQSPFEHIHPEGTRGVRLGSGNPTDGIRYVFPTPLRSKPGGLMHFTLDFRTVADATQKGAYRFYLGRGVIQSMAIQCSVTSSEFAMNNGAKWEVVRRVEPGTWYTLRVTLDPSKKTYSGFVGTADDLTGFKDKRLTPNWDGIADCFICDGFGHVPGAACARDLDNIGFQEQPFGKIGTVVRTDQLRTENVNREAIDAEIKKLTAMRTAKASVPAYEVAYGVDEGTAVNARIQQRGEPARLGDEVPRRFLEVLGDDIVPADSGSGRLQLADWLTRPTNPLTARVFVNRVWQWHFGQGLVTTPSDFGSRGERPSHPALLDWLAFEFMSSGWSIKSLHRKIMLSRTYRLASNDHDESIQTDPGNRWLWRYQRRPLDAESIRDSMLFVSGGLDRSAPQPHPFPDVNTWDFTIHRPFHAVYDSNHRSVYLMVQRNRRHPYLALFDAADPNQSVASRQPTTTPTQALFLMNSPFVHKQADLFAGRIVATSKQNVARVRFAFEAAHGRLPESSEFQDAVSFVSSYREKLDGPKSEQQAWAALARVLLTSNAFLYME